MAKRKKILIDPSVQWALSRRMVRHWFLFAACLFSVNVVVSAAVSISDLSMSEAFAQGLRAQIPMLAVMLALMPIFVYDTMCLSHRFAGPIFRLRGAITSLAQGHDNSALAFRDGDFWQDVASEFNGLRERVEDLEQRNRDLEDRLHAAQTAETAGV